MRQPQPFGKYLLLERISVGGMAEVFKAKPLENPNGKILAIKRILPSMAEDADFIQMFIDEAKISGQLNHNNIAAIYELGRVDDAHFIAMEFVWGKDLLQIQNRFRRIKQTMTPRMAAYVASRMCDGLDYAHRKVDAAGNPLGVIHRDVSPQNVLVSYDGDVKVIDFGIAKAASRSTKTQAGVLKGKFGYMSPEQVRGLPLDRRSDVFAIATILYEMLTAERLFLGESDFSTLEKVRNVDIAPPSQQNPKCPPELERIIMKGLAKEVEDRYQWASDMMVDLDAFLVANPFQPSELAAWMKEQFSTEIKREAAVLAEQRKAATPAAVAAVTPADAAPAHAGGVDGFDGATQITGPGFGAELAAADAAAAAAAHGAPSDMAGQSTMILDGSGAAPPALAGQSTMILQAPEIPAKPELQGQSTMILQAPELPARPELAGQSTMILQAPEIPVGGKPPLLGQSTMILEAPSAGALAAGGAPMQGQSTMILQAPVLPPGPLPGRPGGPPRQTGMVAPITGPGQLAAYPETSTVSKLPYLPPPRKKKSTLGRDLGIVGALAAAIVGGGLGARYYLETHAARGTLVVTVSPAVAAAVLVDGREVGKVVAGKPLTLKEVAAGPHKLLVRAAEGLFQGEVAVAAADVHVVAATLTPSAKGPVTAGSVGKLKLELRTKGATVFIDGAQLDEETLATAIPLKAGVEHEVRVEEAAHEPIKISVTLKPGEERQQPIELPVATAHLTVTSDPPGAEVTVNGKAVGVTPVTLDDLDPTKEAKVVVHKHGASDVKRTVVFNKDRRQTLEVRLGGSSSAVASNTPSSPSPSSAATPKKGADDDDLAPVGSNKAETKKPASSSAPAAAGDLDTGYLVANTQPWAKVAIDGKDTGKTTPIAPRSKIPLKAGSHVVTFSVNGKSWNFDIVVKAGEDTRLIRKLGD